jgi:hypothetical protein
MNTLEAVKALDASADRVLAFVRDNNWKADGPFALFVQHCDEQSVLVSQAAELARAPGRPLIATAGMKPGDYAVLAQLVPDADKSKDVAKVWMSTHVAERTTQAEFVAAAHGRVLVAGLGLGLVLGPLLDKPEVTEIVVVDVNPAVPALMAPYLEGLEAGRRLRLVRADINRWRCRSVFDVIYFDIWPDISARNLPEMLRLETRYRRHLRAGGWMGCWAKDESMEMLSRDAKRFPKIAELHTLLAKKFVAGADLHICHIDEETA